MTVHMGDSAIARRELRQGCGTWDDGEMGRRRVVGDGKLERLGDGATGRWRN